MLEASPLGHLLDALPVIGRALAKRSLTADGGAYNQGGQKVTVRSNVRGGLFVWSQQLEEHHSDANATLDAFTHWLWSGNGFSAERYAKLGLQRPKPPSEFLRKKAEEEQAAASLLEGGLPSSASRAITEGTSYGLEGLRLLEGMEAPHDAGAIVNPAAYRDPARKSAGPGGRASVGKAPPSGAAAGLLKSLGTGKSAFGKPTRSFGP